MPSPRPVLNDRFESNIPGLYIVGDLAGAPVVKLAMEQGDAVARRIANEKLQNEPNGYHMIVIGGGAAGLSAALTARELGLRVLVLEKTKLISTFEDFPEGKWIYAEPEDRPAQGKLWLEGAAKEVLIDRWLLTVRQSGLEVCLGASVTSVRRRAGGFDVSASTGTYRAARIVLATGQRGNPRKLGVPGEDRQQVFHHLYSPKHYNGEQILVVGGGNSAAEAALALAEQNRVVLSYRGAEFTRLFKDNRRKLESAVASGRITLIFNSNVKRFGERTYTLSTGQELSYDHAFVLIGADAPTAFLKSLGIKLENEWTIGRFVWLAAAFAIAYTIYGVKQGAGAEYWPFRGWGAHAFTFFNRPWSFWYTVLYTAVVTIFGLKAMKRWGIDRKDRMQIWRYTSLIGFQWVFFFIIPEFLFRFTASHFTADPNLLNNSWRSYGLIYAWPLFFSTFAGSPDRIWVIWGLFLSFVIIPVLVLFHGKRYCSWICGCGGLAETLGDRWRHLAPKGNASIRWERMNGWILGAAVVTTLMMLTRDAVHAFNAPSALASDWYHVMVDTWLVGIIPVALYPFFGGKIWCRYWCPLAKMMQIFSSVFTRFRISRFAIHANDKCIACGECSRNCQVGINVMQFAMKQEELNNFNTSCIGCGICVTVCPMNVLSFAPQFKEPQLVQIASKS
jgi:NosR/NirI family transcriptional regulator, nitrous oxide reductase regulator